MAAEASVDSICAADLEPLSMQASVFTPERDPDGWARFCQQTSRWAHLFDGEPAVLDEDTGVALVSLRSTSAVWRLDIARDRADLYWMRAQPTTPAIQPADFHAEAVPLLQAYVSSIKARVGRLAAVMNRFARRDAPAALLAGHFCRDRWNQDWLGDSTSFDLQVHKRIKLGRFDVNYRMRSRAGTAFGTGNPPLVNVEQDANTRGEVTAYARHDGDAIAEFFRLAAAEHDRVVLSLYRAGDRARDNS